MDWFSQLLSNRILLCALTSWLAAQVLKMLLYWALEHEFDIRRMWGAGGMPSSHSALVFSLAFMTGVESGFDTPAFAIAFALMTIVMHDATGVRRETGRQGIVINKILRDVLIGGKPITEENLKELVGHTPLEVLGGVVVGLVVTLLFIL